MNTSTERRHTKTGIGRLSAWIVYGFAMAMFLFATTVVSYVVYHYILVQTYNQRIYQDAEAAALAEFKDKADALNESAGEVVVDPDQLADLEVVILASVEQGGFMPFALTIGTALVLFAIMAMVVPHPHGRR